jgi:hypothetical protein
LIRIALLSHLHPKFHHTFYNHIHTYIHLINPLPATPYNP